MQGKQLRKLEAELWRAADQLRANSKLTASEYSMPVLGLIFLRHAYNRFQKVKVEVEDDAEIIFLPTEKVAVLIKTHPEWLDYIFRLYHKRFEELLEIVNAIAFKKVDERLLNLLHKKAELTDNRIIAITHEQLANELGTARVVVSRLLKQLEDQGAVKLGRNKITLV